MDAFRLTKWYLDAVDPEGRSAIAYWSRLSWGRLAIGWEGLSLHPAGAGTATHRSGRARGAEPAWSGGALTWRSRGLGLSVRCEPWCERYASRLLDSADGTIDWTCHTPGAAVTFDAGDAAHISGPGYAEQIDVTVLPWRLPIAELRWGRWVSARTRRSLAWIDWRGEQPLTLVLDRGLPREQAVVADGTVTLAANRATPDGGILRLDRSQTLYTRKLSDVLDGIRPLAARLPVAWLAVEDRKTRSVGTLEAGPGDPDDGWAIHELVRFPGGRISP